MFAYYYFLNLRKLQVAQKLQKDILSVLQWTLLWPVIVDKAIVQQNKIKLLHCNEIRWNKNKEAWTFPVVSTNQLPTLLKNWKALKY